MIFVFSVYIVRSKYSSEYSSDSDSSDGGGGSSLATPSSLGFSEFEDLDDEDLGAIIDEESDTMSGYRIVSTSTSQSGGNSSGRRSRRRDSRAPSSDDVVSEPMIAADVMMWNT